MPRKVDLREVYADIWDVMEGMDPIDAAAVLGRLQKDWSIIAFNCDGQKGENEFESAFLDATIPDEVVSTQDKLN